MANGRRNGGSHWKLTLVQFNRPTDGGRYGARELNSLAGSINWEPASCLASLSVWYGGNIMLESPFSAGGSTGGVYRGGNAAALEKWFVAADKRDNGGWGYVGRWTADDAPLLLTCSYHTTKYMWTERDRLYSYDEIKYFNVIHAVLCARSPDILQSVCYNDAGNEQLMSHNHLLQTHSEQYQLCTSGDFCANSSLPN